jgi:Tetratricopeptide repeat
VVQRTALLVLAAAAVAWLAFAYRDARLEARGIEISFNPIARLTPAKVDEAVDLFERSREGNPDTRPLQLEADLLWRTGHLERARRLLEDVVRREPENHDGWALLAAVTARSDPSRSAEARRQARALNPLGRR